MRDEIGRRHISQTKKGMLIIWKCIDSLLGQHRVTEGFKGAVMSSNFSLVLSLPAV